MLILDIWRAAVPELVKEMAGATLVDPTTVLLNVIVLADSVATGVGANPVQERAINCGEPYALSAMRTEADRAPAIAGLKVTVMVQLAPAATPVPHVLVWLNDAGLWPV